MMNFSYLIATLIAVAASAGQIVLKMAVDRHQQQMLVDGDYVAILFQPLLWLGVFIYAACSVAWLFVLSKSNVSNAYPILSLSFALVPVFAFFFLRESISTPHAFAIAMIIVGVIVLNTTS